MTEEGISYPEILRALREEEGLPHWPAAVMRVLFQVPSISLIGLL